MPIIPHRESRLSNASEAETICRGLGSAGLCLGVLNLEAGPNKALETEDKLLAFVLASVALLPYAYARLYPWADWNA